MDLLCIFYATTSNSSVYRKLKRANEKSRWELDFGYIFSPFRHLDVGLDLLYGFLMLLDKDQLFRVEF